MILSFTEYVSFWLHLSLICVFLLKKKKEVPWKTNQTLLFKIEILSILFHEERIIEVAVDISAFCILFTIKQEDYLLYVCRYLYIFFLTHC